jgi:tripartite-type tricarboxylate transporter receptor subunit TctC
MKGKGVVLASVFLTLCGFFAALASAAEYPTRPLEIICPFSAGSDPDLMARLIANVGSRHFGQPIVVVDKAGGAGAIAVGDVISSKPDGHKAVWESHAYFATTVKTQKVPFNANDLIPVANFYEMKQGLAVRADGPFKTLDDLLDYGKKHPGELKWAHSGRGMIIHLSAMVIFRKAGLSTVEVPYKGSSDAGVALLGGHVDACTLPIATVIEQVRAGKIRFLAVYSDKRYSDHPNVPTVVELGFTQANLPSFWGLYIRKDTPALMKNVLTDMCKKIAEDPELKKGIEKLGGQPRYGGPDFVMEAIKRSEDIGVPLLKELGLYVEK